MPRLVMALFRDPAQAQQGLQALMTMGIAQHRVTAVGLDDGREISSISGFRSLDIPEESRVALRGLEIPGTDLDLFEQGLRRGYSLIAVRIDQEDHEEAIRVLEMFNPVDLDRDSSQWAKEAAAREGETGSGSPLGAGITGGSAEGLTNTGSAPGMGTLTDNGSSLGTADLRNGGSGSTVPTGQGADGRRENLPGVNELRRPAASRPPDTGLLKREMNRHGPVWSYGTE